MPRLLICSPSASSGGGAERLLDLLRRRLPEHGFEVVLGLARGRVFHDPERFRAAFPGPRWIELDGRGGTRRARLASLRRAIAREQPDVVLVCRLFDALHAACDAKAAGARLRLAVTALGNEPEYLFDLERYAAFVDVVFSDGRLTAEAVRRLSVLPDERVVAIPIPVAAPRVPRRVSPDRVLRLGYAGRVEQPQKRALDLVDTLARLARSLVRFTCRVAGAGPAEDELRHGVAAAGLGGRVRFEGWLDTHALYDRFYPELDVFLHFAAWEGNPVALREAAAHGVVPVLSRFTGCRAEGTFRDGETALLFDVGDTAAAAEAVSRLDRDRALLARLAANARRCGGPSEAETAAAWASALARVLSVSPRLGRVPALPPAGRLDAWPLPAALVASLRRFRPGPEAAEPGAEWPHWSGLAHPAELTARRARLAEIEAALAAAEAAR